MGGGSIKKPTQKRSINFTTETLETLDKLAAKNHTTTSELVRGYVEKGLSIEGSREDIDFIARIIRQEITAVYVPMFLLGVAQTASWMPFRGTVHGIFTSG